MIRRAAVQKVDVAGRQIDSRKEMLRHERAVAAFVVRSNADELIEVERMRVGEIRPALFVQPCELVVDRQRRSSRG
jgi:hypothetical protein